MSVFWSLYGGHDLASSGAPPPTRKAAFSKHGAQQVRCFPGRRAVSWRVYPEDTEEARRLVLVANDVEVLDRITSSDMNKFLYQYSSESCPRQLTPTWRQRPGPSPDSDAPVLSITQQDAPLGPGEDEPDEDEDEEAEPAAGAVRPAEQHPIFFRTFTFSPEVLIRIDYQGKRVDIGQFGPLIGLLIGLGQLNCSEIRLKRISHKSGLLGLDRLVHFALNEWLTDIRSNQLPSLLGGIGPLHSFVQLFQGIRDLLWLPIEQYQNGRIVKGLQRGANSFSTSTAMAFLELTNRLVGYIQGASEFAYDMMSPGPSVRQKRKQKRSRRRTSNLPQDLREGVTQAYELVKEGLGETAQTLARVAAEEHDQKGVSGAVGGVLRQIPPTVVKPLLLVSEATSNVLGGMRNQLAPDARREAIDKWKAAE
ncbi:LOW QUALITY PROTEIN: autophagy-related protein 2 homolog A-like [Pollicipes pollicipes]|uniref:LOW QUALITY PROTEIN: autophagy-related protein 2 homolog A-like n=1 Tax=Pollicipes pollicipes TaxID=41117 RepID=UPI00188563C7|nr:LOW QUALITY PROTEIN: autophagy-related protein 2 homolog A-like [Pollicipes pollicipes]